MKLTLNGAKYEDKKASTPKGKSQKNGKKSSEKTEKPGKKKRE